MDSLTIMDFLLFPWDRKRPRLHTPQAQNTLEHGGTLYGLRAQNGLLFLRERGESKTLAVATPLTPAQETAVESFPAIAQNALESGDIARFVVGYDSYLERTLPLFLRADGTGFCRESWNRDDLPFESDVSRHEWMEGADGLLAAHADTIGHEFLHAQLASLDTLQTRDLEWICGSPQALQKVSRWICWIEAQLWDEGLILKLEIGSENEFARACVRGLWLQNCDGGARWCSIEPDALSDNLTVWDESELSPTHRLIQLFGLALDENTPASLGWQYHDYGAGRCANEPKSEIFQIEVPRPTMHEVVEARHNLSLWLRGKIPADQIKNLLKDDAPAALPKHKWIS